jgi:hypothetical protein
MHLLIVAHLARTYRHNPEAENLSESGYTDLTIE